ncbi:MAG: hypothetical protein AB7S38_11565 [Vulcanimicrobiota bacterium]
MRCLKASFSQPNLAQRAYGALSDHGVRRCDRSLLNAEPAPLTLATWADARQAALRALLVSLVPAWWWGPQCMAVAVVLGLVYGLLVDQGAPSRRMLCAGPIHVLINLRRDGPSESLVRAIIRKYGGVATSL